MWTKLLAAVVMPALLVGCAKDMNPDAPPYESATLSNVIQLTSGFDAAAEAYFSRDMRWIIFQAIPTGEKRYQMYVASVKDAATGIIAIAQPKRISPENSRNTCGYISPDGLSIIFASTAGKEVATDPVAGYQRGGSDNRWVFPTGMEIYRADGWESALAAAQPGTITDLAKHPLTDNKAYDAECAYSSDGKWIVFTSNRTGDLDIYAMHPDGTSVVQLTNTPGYDGGPFFSPDGKRIVYRSDRHGDNRLQIFVADIQFGPTGTIIGTNRERQLTRGDAVNWGPSWHPDGRHIVYAASGKDPKNYDLWMMRDDGTRKTRITFDEGVDILPVFSPDGNYLMWTSTRAGGKGQIYLARFKMPAGV